MGIFTFSEHADISFLINGRTYSALIDVDSLLWVASHVHVIVWGPSDPKSEDQLYSDCFEYNTFKRGDYIIYEASANARDYVRKALQ